MSNKDEDAKAAAMSATAKLNDGQVPKGSTAGYVQGSVDKGQPPQQGLSEGMSSEGKMTGGKYSPSTGAAQGGVDRNT